MVTYDEYSKTVTIYGFRSDADEWSQLCGYLSNNKVNRVYFHYVSYDNESDLLSALSKATELKSVLLKGSSFYFGSPTKGQQRGTGLGIILDSLHSHQNLEHIQIRNYTAEELDEIFEHLVPLLEQNTSIKRLSLEHLTIDCKKFKLLCDLLARPGVELELDLEYAVHLSEENKILLKRALDANKSIKVSENAKKMLEEEKDTKECLNSNLNFLILSGCLEVVGIPAVVIAFTVLNAATFGTAGLVVASLGAVSILAGIGLFAYDRYKAYENNSNSDLEVVHQIC